jgi:MFS family permease
LGNGLSRYNINLFRVVWGFLSSRVGFKLLFVVAASMNIIAFLVIIVAGNPTLYLIFYTVNSISLGGMMVIFPNLALLIFGKKIGESIYSYYWVTFSLSNLFQFLIYLLLTNNPTTSDDYGKVLIFFTICVFGAIGITYK